MGSIRYLQPLCRLQTIQSGAKAGGGRGVGGGILLGTGDFAECVFEMDGLSWTAFQCACI